MKHLVPFAMKFGIITIAVLSIFSSFENVTLGNALFISLLLTALAYILGDLFILRRFGNLTATIADFALTFLVLFIYGTILDLPTGHNGNAAAFTAMFIAFVEAFLHFYLMNKVFGEQTYTDEDRVHVRQISSKNLQTETSDEVFPYDVRRKNKKNNEDKEE